MSDYKQTVEYLFSRLPMFSRLGKDAYKADLHNIIALCKALDNPQQKFKSVHIAGTNGKGSVSHSLAAIFQQAGYKTGLYTSPHLKDFRERIRVNGSMVEEAFVIDFTNNIKSLIETIEPSFFEITVAMAFQYFANQQVDIAIIETGLGGRLDSTNLITPQLSVITNIGFDHMNLLGDTLNQIAFEKAGIIKQNVPVVIGEAADDTMPVFMAKSLSLHAPITFANLQRSVTEYHISNLVLKAEVLNNVTKQTAQYELSLTGLYQLNNLLTILEAVEQMRMLGWNLDDASVKYALLHVQDLTGLAGRWQIVHQSPLTVLDVGHNVDGIQQIVNQLKQCSFNQLHIVIGMVKDKDINAVLSLLPQNAIYYFTRAGVERALSEIELQQKAALYQLHGNHYSEVMTAFQAAADNAGCKDMILVCGSVFVVGEISPKRVKWKSQ